MLKLDLVHAEPQDFMFGNRRQSDALGLLELLYHGRSRALGFDDDFVILNLPSTEIHFEPRTFALLYIHRRCPNLKGVICLEDVVHGRVHAAKLPNANQLLARRLLT